MRKHYSDEPEDSSIDMTPMLDIVFIMLIFFVVTTSFVKETGIDIERPSAQTAERQERGNILVAIDESGAIWVDRRRIELGAVRANIERLRAEYPGGSVVVQADTNSRSGMMVAVLDQIRLAGVENIAIAASADQ